MATFALEITNGSTTYTFDVQPRWKPSFSWEQDASRVPAVRIAEIETWVLEGAVYRSSTATNNTSDLETLRALLAARSSPVSAVTLKYNGSEVRSLTTTTHQGGVFAQSLDVGDSPGQFATYWIGTIVVYGRRLFGDGDNIVTLERSLEYEYDVAGLATVTSRGSLTTLPGTSAEAKARDEAAQDEPSGADYRLQTYGPGGSEPSVAVLDATDTRASWTAVWKQFGETPPTGCTWYEKEVETVDDQDGGKRVRTTLRARGPTMTTVRSAVRALVPSTKVTNRRELESTTSKSFEVSYEQAEESRQPDPENPGLVFRRVSITAQGMTPAADERDCNVYPVPGHKPFFVERARQPITITEQIRTQYRGDPHALLAVLGLDSRVRGKVKGLRFQPGASSPPEGQLAKKGETRDADLWDGSATYVFLADEVTPEALFAIVKDQVI